jgi:hypothetical protein
MPLQRTARAAIACGLLWAAAPTAAHHAGSILYDSTKPLTLTGTIVKVEWRYPHAGFTLDVTDARGQVATWEFVLEGPNNALRRGWPRTSLKVGDVVTVKGFPAKGRPLEARATEMTLSDGRPLVSAVRPAVR